MLETAAFELYPSLKRLQTRRRKFLFLDAITGDFVLYGTGDFANSTYQYIYFLKLPDLTRMSVNLLLLFGVIAATI